VGISIAARKYDFSAITPFETSDILDLRPGSCKLLREFAKTKYEFELPELSKTTVKKIYVLCNLSQKVGISIAARKYDFSAITPFETSDILDLRPVIKHSVPVCSEAKDLAEMRKVQLAEIRKAHSEGHSKRYRGSRYWSSSLTFLNCFFGNYQAAGGKARAAKNQKKDQSIAKKDQ
ncbi:hypothetical protein AALP_AAs60056U000100, partial [Arabis alpina]